MSHHYSMDKWHELMLQSLKSRLPKGFGAYYYSPTLSKLEVNIYKPYSKNMLLGNNVEATINWPTCSPYTAASIILHKWLKEAANK